MTKKLNNHILTSQDIRDLIVKYKTPTRGFTYIAFPIVRRVFAGLIANEIVSVQPMSLPTGLLFYLDYTYGSKTSGSADDISKKKHS